MKYIYLKIFIITLVITTFSCSPEDGVNGTDGIDGVDGLDGGDVSGSGYLVISGDITNEEAAALATETAGKNTHTLVIKNTTNLTSLELPEISTLVRLEVVDNQNLQRLSLPNLNATYQDTQIFRNEALVTIEMPNLNEIFGSFSISRNGTLTAIDISQLTKASNLSIFENPVLETISTPSLIEVISRLDISENENLSTLDLGVIESVGILEIDQNEKLSNIDIPGLRTFREILIFRNPTIENINLPALTNDIENDDSSFIDDDADAAFLVSNNTNLVTVNLNALTTVQGIAFRNNENLTTLNTDAMISSGFVSFRSNPKVTAISFANVTNIRGVSISENQALTSISFPNVTETDLSIFISENPVLANIDFPRMTASNGINISENERLESINFNTLVNNEGGLFVTNNENLSTVSFPNLEVSKLGFSISRNTILTAVDCIKLSAIGTEDTRNTITFTINDNPLLNSIDFSSLTSIENSRRFEIIGNPALAAASFPLLNYTGDESPRDFTTPNFTIRNNTTLGSLDFSSLATIDAEFEITGNPALTSLSFPLLTSVGVQDRTSDFIIMNNNLITSITFPNLEIINSTREIEISENVLETVDFGNLTILSILEIDSTVLLTSVNLSSIQDFSRLNLATPGKLSTSAIDGILSRLVSITPAISEKNIFLTGVASAQALTNAETLRANGNTVMITE